MHIMQLDGVKKLISYNHKLYGDEVPLRNQILLSKWINDLMVKCQYPGKSKTINCQFTI